MEKSYLRLLENNKAWSTLKKYNDPIFFDELAQGQHPEYLWIGCSDSRVPANEVTGTKPGEIFEHRNIANMVVHTDMNLLSVLSYGVEVLKVKHIIVCGHYGCGGVLAAMGNKQFGLIDNWLRNIKDVYRYHHEELDSLPDLEVHDLGKTTIVQNAWKKQQPLHIHGWVYDMKEGLINDLDVTFKSEKELHSIYHFEGNGSSENGIEKKTVEQWLAQ
jgi:carbonic anhydrase